MITTDEVIAIMRDLPKDRKNPAEGCVYTSSTGEHCIAGEVLSILGILPGLDILNQKYTEWQILNKTSISAIAGSLNLPLSDDALDVLDVAQKAADEGATWGEAMEGILT